MTLVTLRGVEQCHLHKKIMEDGVFVAMGFNEQVSSKMLIQVVIPYTWTFHPLFEVPPEALSVLCVDFTVCWAR